MAGESIIETMLHKMEMIRLGNKFIMNFMERMREHDDTKLSSPEVEGFDATAGTISDITYGSEEDTAAKDLLKVALTHHYARERHHPEHFDNGIVDMNLVDIIEHFLYCMAASLRHDDGNFRLSLKNNAERFHYPEELTKIFENTIDLFDD